MNQNDIAGKVGTALASIGSFVAGYIQSDIIFNELVRLFSSCTIAALGALIGYKVTSYLKRLENRKKQAQESSLINPGAVAPKHSARYKKTQARRRFAPKPKDDEA